MIFLRDEMVTDDLSAWRYGFEEEMMYWWSNAGKSFDEISLLLFGA